MGKNGKRWIIEFKKFLRKEETWKGEFGIQMFIEDLLVELEEIFDYVDPAIKELFDLKKVEKEIINSNKRFKFFNQLGSHEKDLITHLKDSSLYEEISLKQGLIETKIIGEREDLQTRSTFLIFLNTPLKNNEFNPLLIIDFRNSGQKELHLGRRSNTYHPDYIAVLVNNEK